MKSSTKDIPVIFEAILGMREMEVAEIRQLKVGSVIDLETVEGDVMVSLNTKPIGTAKILVQRNKLNFQINKVFED